MGHEPGRTSQGHSGWRCRHSSFGELTGFLDLMLTWFSSDLKPFSIIFTFWTGQQECFLRPQTQLSLSGLESESLLLRMTACPSGRSPAFLDPRPLYRIVAADAGVCLEHCSSSPSLGKDQKPPQPTGSSCPLPHPAPWHILEEGLLPGRAVHPQIC